jgi:hypothetical protein
MLCRKPIPAGHIAPGRLKMDKEEREPKLPFLQPGVLPLMNHALEQRRLEQAVEVVV